MIVNVRCFKILSRHFSFSVRLSFFILPDKWKPCCFHFLYWDQICYFPMKKNDGNLKIFGYTEIKTKTFSSHAKNDEIDTYKWLKRQSRDIYRNTIHFFFFRRIFRIMVDRFVGRHSTSSNIMQFTSSNKMSSG